MRKHYIDNLRWITILLLIPYHAAMAWNIWNEPNYLFFSGNKIISSIIIFLNPYFMPILFILSGISMKLSLLKRTPKQYVSERIKKLLIPLVFGTLCIMPIMTYIADKFNYKFEGNLLSHYIIFFTKYSDLTGADGGFSFGQYWFILYLLIISLITILPITTLRKKHIPSSECIPLWLVTALGLPLPILSELLSIGGKSLIEYTYLFLMGYFIFSNDCTINKIEKYKWLFLFIGLTSTIINVYMFIWSDLEYPLLNNAAKFISEWFMIIALIGLGKKYLNFSNKISNYISKKSFYYYIFHFIWIIIFQYLLNNIFNNTVVLFILPICLSYITTFLCCEIFTKIHIYNLLQKFASIITNKLS